MAGLVEYLMMGQVPEEQRISTNAFYAAMIEVISGNLTVAQVKSFITNQYTGNTDADAEIDALVVQYQGLSTDLQRVLWTHRIHAVLYLAESVQPAGYSTPAEVRTKLGLL